MADVDARPYATAEDLAAAADEHHDPNDTATGVTNNKLAIWGNESGLTGSVDVGPGSGVFVVCRVVPFAFELRN